MKIIYEFKYSEVSRKKGLQGKGLIEMENLFKEKFRV